MSKAKKVLSMFTDWEVFRHTSKNWITSCQSDSILIHQGSYCFTLSKGEVILVVV